MSFTLIICRFNMKTSW